MQINKLAPISGWPPEFKKVLQKGKYQNGYKETKHAKFNQN